MNETNEKWLYYVNHLRNDIIENLGDHDVLYTQISAWAAYITRMYDDREALRARLTLTEAALTAGSLLIGVLPESYPEYNDYSQMDNMRCVSCYAYLDDGKLHREDCELIARKQAYAAACERLVEVTKCG